MVPDLVLWIFIVCIGLLVIFMMKIRSSRDIRLLQKMYLVVSVLFISWLLALIAVKFTDPNNLDLLYVWDAIMYLGTGFLPPISLMMVLVFTRGLDKLPSMAFWLLVVPTISNIMVWTNPIHHLFYRVFAVVGTDVVFGPFLYLSGSFSVGCMLISTVMMLNFAIKSKSSLYLKQAAMFLIGILVPLVINVLMLLRVMEPTIVATPLGFIVTMICHGYVIYRLHFFDIRPIAMQQVLNLISDGYLVTNEKGLIVNFNTQFRDIFGREDVIEENKMLSECIKEDDVDNKTALYNLITSIDSSKKTETSIYYEQAVNVFVDGEMVKRFYMAEIKPLLVFNRLSGFICIFKDITKVKESMQRLQNSQVRMMERERLASLGQMMGGMAHNLKTPIMSISGSSTAIENLVRECVISMGDPDVTQEDYREIYNEINDWLQRVRVACTYMSDIISAVKGQATTMNVSNDTDFSTDEMIKRVSLLLRHELQNNGCRIAIDKRIEGDVLLHGDINNLVQVVNNLVSNAVDAMQPKGGGVIVIGIEADEENLHLTVRDHGTGVPPDIKKRLFKQMITSKGAMGTGLGIYISNVVIRGKFGGEMWLEDNEGGGSIFGISIPRENVRFITKRQMEVIS